MARRRRTAVHVIAVLAALAATAGCRLKDQTAPSLVGPSELGLSLTTTATPDLLTRDGASQSVITVTARDEAGQARANVPLRVDSFCDTSAGRRPTDAGRLSSQVLSTGQDGRATTVYTAPTEAAYLSSYCVNEIVYVDVTPVGQDYSSTFIREVIIRLVADPLTPIASFVFTPTTPRINEDIVFDGRASHAAQGRQIVDYFWQFGTDRTGHGSTIVKRYDTAATYFVSLTVTDDVGRQGRITIPVRVQ